MKNYFIVHGTYGNSSENWFPWLEKELRKANFDVYNLDYPTPENQNYSSWKNILDKIKNKINKESIFIGHSLGCIFIARYIIENQINIDKCIFVSGFNNYFKIEAFDKLNISFFIERANQLKNYTNERITIYSKDDPYISFTESKRFSKEISATKQIAFTNAGHFNEKAGYTKFEEILKYL
jgi:predicted alpha/beta hydrolase family esterase